MQSSNEIIETETKFIGTPIPTHFHTMIKKSAEQEGVSISLFLRRACLDRLSKQKKEPEHDRG
jgi:hypothetical protein